MTLSAVKGSPFLTMENNGFNDHLVCCVFLNDDHTLYFNSISLIYFLLPLSVNPTIQGGFHEMLT